jgi:DNA repair protein RecO (recombination protein O)
MPLSLLAAEARFSENMQVSTAREVNVVNAMSGIRADLMKSTMSLFMCEVLHRSLPDGYTSQALFDYLCTEISLLDTFPAAPSTLLYFMLRLCHFYGFYPADGGEGTWFDLREGIFQAYPPPTEHALDPAVSTLLRQLIVTDLDHSRTTGFTYHERKHLLHALVTYMRCHVEGMGAVRSLEVLETVFHD